MNPVDPKMIHSLAKDADQYGVALVILLILLVAVIVAYFMDKRSQRKNEEVRQAALQKIEDAREAERIRIEAERESRDQQREERLGRRLDEMQNQQTGMLLTALQNSSKVIGDMASSGREQAQAINNMTMAIKNVGCLASKKET